MNTYVNWKGWEESDFGSFTQEQALYYRAELRKSGINALHGLRVGELGFGNGSFAGWVREQGGQWIGKEINSVLQQRALQAGYDVVAFDEILSNKFDNQYFDVIVAFDVLEHLDIDEIRKFLLESKSALKFGGSVIFRVPSGDSPFSGAIFRGDLTHQTLLGSSAVRQIVDDVDLKLYQVRSPVLPIFGLGVFRAMRRLVIYLLQFLFFSFIRNYLMGNSRAVISPNMIVVCVK